MKDMRSIQLPFKPFNAMVQIVPQLVSHLQTVQIQVESSIWTSVSYADFSKFIQISNVSVAAYQQIKLGQELHVYAKADTSESMVFAGFLIVDNINSLTELSANVILDINGSTIFVSWLHVLQTLFTMAFNVNAIKVMWKWTRNVTSNAHPMDTLTKVDYVSVWMVLLKIVKDNAILLTVNKMKYLTQHNQDVSVTVGLFTLATNACLNVEILQMR